MQKNTHNVNVYGHNSLANGDSIHVMTMAG